jgi:hypothetical protein
MHSSIVDSPTTRQACLNLGVQFNDLTYKTLDQLKKEVGNADLFQRWKDNEKSRRLKYASVMKERRRLKAIQDKQQQPSTPPSINENSTAASASLKQTKRLSPPSQMSGRVTVGGYGSSNLTQLKRMQHEARDPKELLELERQKLQQIIEEEVRALF